FGRAAFRHEGARSQHRRLPAARDVDAGGRRSRPAAWRGDALRERGAVRDRLRTNRAGPVARIPVREGHDVDDDGDVRAVPDGVAGEAASGDPGRTAGEL